jgi:hypothetical protein
MAPMRKLAAVVLPALVTILALVVPAAYAEQRTGTSTGQPPAPRLSGAPEPAIRTVTVTYSTDGALEIQVSLYAPIDQSGSDKEIETSVGLGDNIIQPMSCSGAAWFRSRVNYPSYETGHLHLSGYGGELEAAGVIGPADTETWVFNASPLAGQNYDCLGESHLIHRGTPYCELPACLNVSVLSTAPATFFSGYPRVAAPKPTPPVTPTPRRRHCSTLLLHYYKFSQITQERSNCRAIRHLLAQWSHSYSRRFHGWRFQLVGPGHGVTVYRWRATKGHQVIRFAEEPRY